MIALELAQRIEVKSREDATICTEATGFYCTHAEAQLIAAALRLAHTYWAWDDWYRVPLSVAGTVVAGDLQRAVLDAQEKYRIAEEAVR